MRKFHSPRSISAVSDPEMALTKIDIQKLLNGKKDVVTPGFGAIELFNHPKLEKPKKKLTSKEIFSTIERIRQKYIPPGIRAPTLKQSMLSLPLKFTFKQKDPEVESNK
jgi:hypothetical protein